MRKEFIDKLGMITATESPVLVRYRYASAILRNEAKQRIRNREPLDNIPDWLEKRYQKRKTNPVIEFLKSLLP